MIVPADASQSVQQAFRELSAKIELLFNGNFDLHGRRLINAGLSIGDYDYVTKIEVTGGQSTSQTIPTSTKYVRAGTYASMPPAGSAKDCLYVVTDRSNIIFYSNGSTWSYACGIHQGTLSSIPTPTAAEAGYLYFATDYGHSYRWTGTGWTFAPGDPGSNFIVIKSDAVPGHGSTWWHICDGSAVLVATDNGGTNSVTTPVLTVEGLDCYLRR